MESFEKGKSGRGLISLLLNGKYNEFGQAAAWVHEDPANTRRIAEELLEIARAEASYEELRDRDEAVNALGYLGLAKEFWVLAELTRIANAHFDDRKLAELIIVEELRECKICKPNYEMRFLRDIMMRLSRFPNGLGAASLMRVCRAFDGTRFGSRLAESIKEANEGRWGVAPPDNL